MKLLKFSVVPLLTVTFFTSCAQKSKDFIVNEWKLVDISGPTKIWMSDEQKEETNIEKEEWKKGVYIFRKDGTCGGNENGKTSEKFTTKYKLSEDKKKIFFTYKYEDPYSMEVMELTKNKFIIADTTVNVKLTFITN